MAHALSPEQIAKLRQDVLAAEQGFALSASYRHPSRCAGAFEAKRKAEVDRIKHSAQLQELSEQVSRCFLNRRIPPDWTT